MATVQAAWWQLLNEIIAELEQAQIDYTLLEESALFVQGVEMPPPTILKFSVQWDLFERAYALFQPYAPGDREREKGQERFSFRLGDVNAQICCYYNTVVVTDPDRLTIEHQGRRIPVKALDYYLRTLPAHDARYGAIKRHLHALHQHNSRLNETAWNTGAYNAWVARFGTPVEAAEYIRKDPQARLGSLTRHLGPLEGRQVINLLGSHGGRAIAMALLGAHVTIVDMASENARYASEVAAAAGVPLRYLVTDVLNLPVDEINGSYGLVLMELGILHYFVDLEPLITIISGLLRSGGRLVLQDFHPVTAKLISSKGKKHKVSGNYFDKAMTTTNVAHSKHLEVQKPGQVYLKQWTLGEVVSAIAAQDLRIRLLEEEPNNKIDDIGLPKVFTIVAEKL